MFPDWNHDTRKQAFGNEGNSFRLARNVETLRNLCKTQTIKVLMRKMV